MRTLSHKLTIFIILFGLTNGFVGASEAVFEVSGWVNKNNKKVKSAVVRVYENSQIVNETETNFWGNFKLFLLADKEYIFTITAEGAREKSVVFHTYTANEKLNSTDFFFEFIVDLYDVENLVESSFHQHLVMFDADIEDFIYLKPIVSEYLLIQNQSHKTQIRTSEMMQNPKRL